MHHISLVIRRQKIVKKEIRSGSNTNILIIKGWFIKYDQINQIWILIFHEGYSDLPSLYQIFNVRFYTKNSGLNGVHVQVILHRYIWNKHALHPKKT